MIETQLNAHIILTANPASGTIALGEIRAIDPEARLLKWLAPGVGWVELGLTWASLARRLREQPPIFCRHICPAQLHLPLKQALADLDDLAEASRRFSPHLSLTQTFSVQTRLIESDWPYARYDVNTRLSQGLVEQGSRLEVRQPEQILSVVLTPEQGYLGLSRAADNLSDWAGGARRFKQEQGQVSRAEFKLLEALELFGLRLPAAGTALDLGAAPGGWTRILRQHALSVVAVDPADLDARIASDPAVRHIRQAAQSYLPATDEQFDVILNDMRMDARASAQVMGLAARNLKDEGWALLTLKLPQRGAVKAAASALEALRAWYEISGARQLFHNRSEITAALKLKLGFTPAM